MNPGEKSVAEYLERLRDLLPTKRADEVVAEVGALIEDRLPSRRAEGSQLRDALFADHEIRRPERLEGRPGLHVAP